MEFIEIVYLMILTAIIGTGMVFLYKNIDLKGTKRARKTIETFSIDTMTTEFNKMKVFYEDKCSTLEKEMKFWRGRANRLEQIEDDGTGNNGQTGRGNQKITSNNLQEHYEIDISSVTKLLPTLNIPMLKNIDLSKIPELINNPLIKNKAWDYIKKNKDEMIQMGVIVPIGQTSPDVPKEEKQEGTREEPKDVGMMKLEFDENNRKYMA